MINTFIQAYDFSSRCAIVTGGAGVLGSAIVGALLGVGANVAILDINFQNAQKVADQFKDGLKTSHTLAIQCDVLDKTSIYTATQAVLAKFGRVDILINGAGGNNPAATTNSDQSFFDLPIDALRWVFDLNLMSTILTSQVVGKLMSTQKSGVILNISSMNAFRPLTRIPAYSAAKAGVNNFTQWLAVHMAKEYSPNIRVNAIAPGFLLGEQNRFLMTNKETGKLTSRGKAVIDHTPMNRFGVPEDLVGAVLWLLSPASAFVTGVVIPVDGGFSAFSGV